MSLRKLWTAIAALRWMTGSLLEPLDPEDGGNSRGGMDPNGHR